MSIAPDRRLGILFGIGGMAGMHLGARCQKFVPAGIIFFTALKYIAEFFAIEFRSGQAFSDGRSYFAFSAGTPS